MAAAAPKVAATATVAIGFWRMKGFASRATAPATTAVVGYQGWCRHQPRMAIDAVSTTACNDPFERSKRQSARHRREAVL